MITKKFGEDFTSEGGALTLPAESVTADGAREGLHTRTHASGWTISGVVREDWYEWVNDFKASHPTFGEVSGNFEETVEADTEEGFAHFWANHTPNAWDYYDI